jgi:hypothetical protein
LGGCERQLGRGLGVEAVAWRRGWGRGDGEAVGRWWVGAGEVVLAHVPRGSRTGCACGEGCLGGTARPRA